jgi:cytochrome P450
MLDYNEKAPQDKKLSMTQMIGNCNIFLIAGYDTTANSINSMIYNLAHRPELLHRLAEAVKHLDKPNLTFQEIDEVGLLEKVAKNPSESTQQCPL